MNVRHCDFSNAKVGDKVFDILFGYGIIKSNDEWSSYPIQVQFDDYFETYLIDGRTREESIFPSLYYNKFEIKIPEEAYKQPLPDIAVDTPIVVWDNENRKSRGYFKCWSHSGKPITFFGGQTSFTSNGSISEWDNYEIVELPQ